MTQRQIYQHSYRLRFRETAMFFRHWITPQLRKPKVYSILTMERCRLRAILGSICLHQTIKAAFTLLVTDTKSSISLVPTPYTCQKSSLRRSYSRGRNPISETLRLE